MGAPVTAPREATPSAATLPNLVIAGVTKGGTTSLFRYLAQHPEIHPSDVKELRYFQPLRYGGELEPLSQYAAHFAGRTGERYAMESTPGYFYGGRALAEGLSETLPDVRVVVSLRDPVERCLSWYNFMRSRARVDKRLGFSEYVDRCLALRASGADGTVENQAYWGIGGGCYDEWLDAWNDVLGDRFTVIFFEDLARDPQHTTAELCRWLGIAPDVTAGFRYDVENKTEQYRSKRLQRAALHVNREAERFFGKHRAVKRRLRRLYYSVNREQSEQRPDDGVLRRLQDFYAPHNMRLADTLAAGQTNLTLPPWLTGPPEAAAPPSAD